MKNRAATSNDAADDPVVPKSDKQSVVGAARLPTSSPKNSSAPTNDQPKHQHSLRSQIVLALAIVSVFYLGLDEFVHRRVIEPEFINLEKTSAVRDTHRTMAALEAEVERLVGDAQRISSLGPDIPGNVTWSPADEDLQEEPTTREFRPAQNNLDVVYGDDVDWAAIVDRKGGWNWVYQTPRIRLWLKDTQSETRPFGNIIDQIQTEHSTPPRGMTRANDSSLYMFASVQLDSVPQKTFLVLGRELGLDVVNAVRHQTDVDFALQPSLRISEQDKGTRFWSADDESLVVEVPLVSRSGHQIAQLAVTVDREITRRSDRAVALARYLSICVAITAMLLVLLMLLRIVVGRLSAIREYTNRIADEGLDVATLNISGSDEIGQLAHAFDRMKNRLSETQTRLSNASHSAGMNLVAETVIHNVGNVLTNVNSLVETASKRISSLRIQPLETLAERLKESDTDSDLQKATPDYLKRLSGQLQNDQQELTQLLGTLQDNIQHIHQVVRDQRRHTKHKINRESVSAVELINEAVQCCQASLEQDQIQVKIDAKSDPTIRTDRSQLLQILINVISNARNSMRDFRQSDQILTIQLKKQASSVEIRVIDNGCGMTQLTLRKVFDAHFTTRESGSGLGLHFCAIALKRLGGSIRAESEGIGRGSTFTIEVPLFDPNATTTLGIQNDENNNRISAIASGDVIHQDLMA